MKLKILCDLHIEFGDFEPPPIEADLVILAGDVHTGKKGVKWAIEQLRNVPVVYVAGNHEFYGNKFPGLIDDLKHEAEGTNIHILENDSMEIGDFRIFGCTLWSDLELFGNHHLASIAAAEAMNDYRLIRLSQTYRRLSPKDTRMWHFRSVQKLTEFLEDCDPVHSIVVTHNAPSIQSIVDRFRNDALTPAFASNLEGLILEHRPLLWVHGHTHQSFDYHIGTTRVICNPRGYSAADNPEFLSDLMIEI